MKIKEYYKINIIKKSVTFKEQRNYGIDLLKIIAMVNIINLHINQHSKLLNLHPSHSKFRQVYRLEAFSFWPVDAFGLISGIIGYKKYKFSNLIFLYFQYFFHSVFLSLYSCICGKKNIKNIIYHFFPIGIRYFWYFNAYFFMYLFLPFLTSSINSINKIYFTKLFYFFLFIYSFYHTINGVTLQKKNFDFTDRGYSTLWILILYIIGSFLGRFHINTKSFSRLFFFCIYLISSLFTSEYLIHTGRHVFMDYLSPTIILQTLSLIFFFSNMKISRIYLIKIMIKFFIPLNFNVSLIHGQILTDNKFKSYILSLSTNFLFFKIYVISILIYLICTFIDYFRFLLFKLFKVRDLCNYIEQKIN